MTVKVIATELINSVVVVNPTPIVSRVYAGPPGPPGGGGASYRQSFTNASLTVANLLVVTHNLNSYPTAIAIYDSAGELVFPDRIEYLTANTLAIALTSFAPLTGTWQLAIGG